MNSNQAWWWDFGERAQQALLLCYRAFFTSCQRQAAYTCLSSSISNTAHKTDAIFDELANMSCIWSITLRRSGALHLRLSIPPYKHWRVCICAGPEGAI